MATANTKLTVDTSQAMMAINGLNTAWVNASAQLNVVGKALDFIASKWASLNKTINDSATFMDAVKNEAGVASVQMAMSVTEGQIKPMELARQQNILMQGSLKMTQDQFDLVAKSAVALADATGQDAGQAFDDLSRSLVSGSVRSLAQFGIQIEEGGTKSERTARILEHLTKQFSGYQVEVTNASDATAKMNSQMELQEMLAARSLDKISRRMSEFKTFYLTEFLPGIIDAAAGTSFSASNQLADMVENQSASITKTRINNEQLLRRAAQETGKIYEINGEFQILYNSRQVEQAKKIIADMAREEELIKNHVRFAIQNGVELENMGVLNARLAKISEDRLKIEKQFGPTIAGEKALVETMVSVYEAQFLPVLQQVADIYGAIWGGGKSAGKPPPKPARESSAMSVEQEKYDAEEVIRRARMERRIEEFARDKELSDQALRDKQTADLKFEMDKSAEQDRIMKDREAARIENVKNAELEIKEAKDKAAAEDKARLESIKAKTIEVSGVVLGAIFAEKKAREGLSRSEYVMKQLAVYMKGQALKYAAESLGYAAQAFAAQFINPPAAAAMWTASATAAAAASAFGIGAAGASKMAGKPSSSSKGSGASSASTQRETVGGTTAQRANVTIVVGERAVLLGTMDDLMRTINGGLNDARRRGVL